MVDVAIMEPPRRESNIFETSWIPVGATGKIGISAGELPVSGPAKYHA
jgi:hypothetical protein